MRDNILEFVRLVRTAIHIREPIVEIGSLQVAGQVGYADLRPYFPGLEFIGCDLGQGDGVDVLENAENLSFDSRSIGTILILDTLEHVQNPFSVMDEIHRVLKPGGAVIMSSVMAWPIHDYPHDYWRFTPQSFELLLQQFRNRFVFYQGQKQFPHAVLGLGIKGVLNSIKQEDIARRLSSATREEIGTTIATPGVCKVVRGGLITPDGAFQPLDTFGVVTGSGRYISFGERFPYSLIRAVLSKLRATLFKSPGI